ncbi:MAG: hypothetical protein M3P08_02495 [Thermoproteota archaeon]|nr:hypothetical protein [Thermoproteota archaeon]
MNREINKRFCVIFTYGVVSKLVPFHIKPAVNLILHQILAFGLTGNEQHLIIDVGISIIADLTFKTKLVRPEHS